ncbi:FIG043197: Inositol monophosphatase family protein [hydrothermal vent metagenome]|uniref:FIG043197: Inositol monophosphatase family protein n=1 Tax=hydrothermal vent metagenome TaxID=652676 RepID=A0A3B0S9C4_9ZZZZ
MIHNPASDDLQLLQMAAREAGKIAMQWFLDPGKVWDKGNNHPVTEADLAIDTYLREHLLGARQTYGWLSEETIDDRSRLVAPRVFVVDPIDGTRAFIQAKPHFTICLAVVENGEAITGVVFNPALDEMYVAQKGQGAKLNGQQIFVSQTTQLADCNMIANEGLFRQKHWKRQWPKMRCATRNSMAYRMVLVASGNWDATLTLRPKSDWDLAAAGLIAQEAGAVVSDPMGQDFCYNLPSTSKSGVICAGVNLHDLIRERIVESQGTAKHHE